MKKLRHWAFHALLLSCLIFKNALAGGLYHAAGARHSGMGRCSVALADFWSVQNNQAGMALIDKFSAGISYENRFLLPALGIKHLAIIAPTGIGVLGITVSHSGYHLYSDMKLGLSYARAFGPRFRAGLQMDYLLTSMGDGYGSTSSITFEMGFQVMVSDQITLAAWVFNPLNIYLVRQKQEKYPVIFRLGIGWQVTDRLTTTLETEKNSTLTPIIARGGIEYDFHRKFYARCGFATDGEIFTVGVGWQAAKFGMDISSVMHLQLGISSQFSLTLQF